MHDNRIFKCPKTQFYDFSSLFQLNALQQNSDVPMITHVFDPLKDAMVTMTVGTIQMNGIAEVNLMHKYFIAKKIVLKLFFHHISVQCSSTQFRCPNDSTCIQSSKKCNGYQDCRDNSDENNCTRYSINIIGKQKIFLVFGF